MNRASYSRKQSGAVIITVSLVLLFLLGFMGIALDLGHLFVVKTELQTAMDSCALAAAQELDGEANALDRATNAGRSAANVNRVNFQSGTWDNKGYVTPADITFKDSAYMPTSLPNAKYAQCSHTQPNVRMWLLHIMGAFSGNKLAHPNTHNVLASAVATRSSAQSACPIPVALKPKNYTSPNYGFLVGEWVTIYGNKVLGSGELGWYNLDATKSAKGTKDYLSEVCGTKIADDVPLGTPGAQTGVDVLWNQRFGIYKNNSGPSQAAPDFSGYAYTATNWTNSVPQNAWSGNPALGSHASAANFMTKRAQFASFDNAGTDLKDGSLIVFGNKNQLNSFQSLATPGVGGQHQTYGYNRRVVLVPVLSSTNTVADFACMLMLHPLSGPQDDGHMEFLGKAGAPNSPCTTNGLAGGTAGPLVPVLVR